MKLNKKTERIKTITNVGIYIFAVLAGAIFAGLVIDSCQYCHSSANYLTPIWWYVFAGLFFILFECMAVRIEIDVIETNSEMKLVWLKLAALFISAVATAGGFGATLILGTLWINGIIQNVLGSRIGWIIIGVVILIFILNKILRDKIVEIARGRR